MLCDTLCDHGCYDLKSLEWDKRTNSCIKVNVVATTRHLRSNDLTNE